MIAALFSALTGASAMILDKVILSKEKVNFLAYMVLSIVFIFVVASFFSPFYASINLINLEISHIYTFITMIFIAYLYNFLYFFSLNHEKVSDVEPLAMTYPLVATLLAAIFYPAERNYYVLFFALVAAVTLLISRVEKRHLKINKYSLSMLGFVFLMAIESLLVKKLLEIFSPLALYTFRTGILAILFLIFLGANIKNISPKKYFHIFIAALTVTAHYVFMYYSISKIGLVRTNLIFILIPIMVLFGSRFILKEKLSKRKIIATFIILLCLVGAFITGGFKV